MTNDRLLAHETLAKAQTDIDLRHDAKAIKRCADAAELLADLADEDDADVESATERIGRAT